MPGSIPKLRSPERWTPITASVASFAAFLSCAPAEQAEVGAEDLVLECEALEYACTG